MAKAGDKVTSATLRMLGREGPKPITTEELFAPGKKVVAFALPGAFTPTCSAKHVPGFVAEADAIKKKGVDTIACISVNDAFVMGAWGKEQKAGDKVMMLGDGNGEFTQAMGLTVAPEAARSTARARANASMPAFAAAEAGKLMMPRAKACATNDDTPTTRPCAPLFSSHGLAAVARSKKAEVMTARLASHAARSS